jgi:hypothetical protein
MVLFFKPCTKLTLHCNHKSGHLKTDHTECRLKIQLKGRHFDTTEMIEAESQAVPRKTRLVGCI